MPETPAEFDKVLADAAEQNMREKLAALLEAMDKAATLGVDVQQIMGEIVRHMMTQAEAAGVEVSPLAKMLFS